MGNIDWTNAGTYGYIWHCIVQNNTDDAFGFQLNNTQTEFSQVGFDSTSFQFSSMADTDGFRLNKKINLGDYGDALIDEIVIWNTTLTQQDLTDIFYGKGSDYDYVAPPTPNSLNITATLPANNTQFHTSLLNLNATIDSLNNFNCSLYVNDVVNQTTTGYSAGSGVVADFNLTFDEGATEETLNYSFRCDDGVSPENSTEYTFYVDNVVPSIDWYTPLNNNGTTINLNDSETFTSNISLTDPNIYSFNYNITYWNGTLLFNYSNNTLTGLGSYDINYLINMSGLVGKYYANVEVCDGHTSKEISDKEITKYDSELWFNDIKIIPLIKSKIQDTDTLKKTDRYNFIFQTKAKEKSLSFYVESPYYIDILNGKTNYKGHLVTGNQWIDFEAFGLEGVSVTRISSNKVRVDVTSVLSRDYWEFNSIGELNCLTETRELFVFDEEVRYVQQTLSYYTTAHNLTIDYNSSFFSGYPMTAYLVWNGDSYAANPSPNGNTYVWSYNHTAPTISTDTNYTFYWNYSLDGTTYYQSDTYTQEIINPRLTNCSEGEKVISFINNEENLLQYLNADIDVDLTYWNPLGNVSQITDFGYTFSNTYNATICMYPSNAPLMLNAYVINEVSASYSHRYFLVNADLTGLAGNPSLINLYNFVDTTDKNTLEVNVVDQYYNPISDIVVKLLRYYPSGIHSNTSVSYAHSWQNVQVDKSDEFGQSVFHISDSGDTDYYFVLESNSTLLKQTATMKLLCPDPTDCKVTFQIDTSEDNSVYSLFDSYTWNYNELTEIVSVTWNDPTGLTSSIGISVTQEKSDGQLIICEQTFATSSGSYTCNTTGYNGVLRVSAYRTASPLVKFLDEFIDKYTAALSAQLSGEGALWGALIFIGIVTASATSVIGVIIASILGLVVIFITGITNVITLSFLIMAIIVGFIIAFKLQR